MVIDAILFDLGGVICEFSRDRRLDALAEACGLSPALVADRMYDSGFVGDCDLGRYNAAEMASSIRGSLGFQGTAPELGTLWSRAFELDEAVLDIVRKIRPGRRLGLLTNNDALVLESLPQVFPEIAREFDDLLFSCVLRAGKPAAEAFSRALARLGTAAGRTLFIDDAPENVTAAREAGLQAVRFTSADQLSRDLAALEAG